MARDHWIALVQSMQMDTLLDEMCLGKVMRLMAADVVFWHFRTGGKLDPDTAVWSVLPLPWEVLAGEAICTRDTVEQACRKYKVDPVKSGWAAARPRTTVAVYRPTPELVHGVTVANPYLATVLRNSGVFSGKSVNLDRLFSEIDKIM